MTYPEMAEHYGVSLEELGWTDRRVTRSGLRRFLIAVYDHRAAKRGLAMEEWEHLWSANRWAYDEALYRWRRQIPSLCSDFDRARVAELLARRPRANDRQRKAWRWAYRRS